MILCIGATPAAQRVMIFPRLVLENVNRATTTLDGAAGKAINVAKVLKSLGENPFATGFLGGDRGDEIQRLLDARDIQSEFIRVQARTRQCITVIDEAAGSQTELVEESCPVEQSDYDKLLQTVSRRLPGAKALVMSGTLTKGASPDFYFHCALLARKAGALSVIDAHGPALLKALEAKPALIKPNRAEFACTFNFDLKSEDSLQLALREMHDRGASMIVITAGKEPAIASDGKKTWRIIPPTIKAVNPIGSGDSFTAGLTWRLLRGDDLAEACRWATAVSAANALTLMPGELNLEDLNRLLPQVHFQTA